MLLGLAGNVVTQQLECDIIKKEDVTVKGEACNQRCQLKYMCRSNYKTSRFL